MEDTMQNRMKLAILVQHRFELWQVPSWLPERLRVEFPQIEVDHLTSYEHAEDHLRDAEVVVTWSLRPEQVRAAKGLRWIHATAAAVHALMIPEVINSNIVVTNAGTVHGPVVAEHVLALILAMAKRLSSAVRFQQEHVWGQEQLWEERPRPREIAGATLGIIGMGAIGRELAPKAAALGMRVLAVRDRPERGFGCNLPGEGHEVYGSDNLDLVLGEADFVVLAAPVTPATKGMMDAVRLGRMKPDAYLINVGRGALIDELALAEALRQKKLGGAALDVFTTEPLPPESPLWDLENVLITPHTAAFTAKVWDRHYALIAENLRRYMARQPLKNVVDKQKGY
jgi:phosphoglycerate dehydrogenase-like enzyme